MHQYLFSIGSNTYAERNLKKVRLLLSEAFDGIVFSRIYISKPYGLKYKRLFHNVIAQFYSDLSATEITQITKRIEGEMGRKHEDKEMGRVVIDIDLIRENDQILRPDDYGRDYVQVLLPDFRLT